MKKALAVVARAFFMEKLVVESKNQEDKDKERQKSDTIAAKAVKHNDLPPLINQF